MRARPNTTPRDQLQHAIDAALRAYFGSEGYVDVPEGVHGSNCHERLLQAHVTQAVTALTRYLGTDGSAGSVDLYGLLAAALLHPQTHEELNEVLRRTKQSRLMQ
jgi:hypothetical protein